MKKIKNIFFPPEKTSLLLSEILKKYELHETSSEIAEKRKLGRLTANSSLISAIHNIATGKMNLVETIEKLRNDLSLSLEKAQEITNELNNTVVPLGKEKAPFQENQEIEKVEVQKKPILKEERVVNPYREPVE